MSQGGNKFLTRKHEKFRFFAIFRQILKKKSHPKKSHNNITPKQKGHKGSNEASAVIVEVTFAKAFLRKMLQNIGERPRYLLLKTTK